MKNAHFVRSEIGLARANRGIKVRRRTVQGAFGALQVITSGSIMTCGLDGTGRRAHRATQRKVAQGRAK